MQYILWATLLSLLLACTEREVQTGHFEYMREHEGAVATELIDKWLAHVNVPPRNPYCAALTSYSLDAGEIESIKVRSGLARHFITKSPKRQLVPAGMVLRGQVEAQPGWLVVYQHAGSVHGHVGIVTEPWRGRQGIYISGNTSIPGTTKRGIAEKPAYITPSSNFRITHFIKH